MLQPDNTGPCDEVRRHIERLRSMVADRPDSLQHPPRTRLSSEARARIHRALRNASHESQ